MIAAFYSLELKGNWEKVVDILEGMDPEDNFSCEGKCHILILSYGNLQIPSFLPKLQSISTCSV